MFKVINRFKVPRQSFLLINSIHFFKARKFYKAKGKIINLAGHICHSRDEMRKNVNKREVLKSRSLLSVSLFDGYIFNKYVDDGGFIRQNLNGLNQCCAFDLCLKLKFISLN